MATRRQFLTLMACVTALLAGSGTADCQTNSVLLEVAGHVDYSPAGSTNWPAASAGLALKPGDRVRTREASRATVQLSDRSVIRLSERTTLEVLPPRRAEKRRFGLPSGSIFFFNREKPADVEFDTPLAAGAIRGTEFVLETTAVAVHLALMDGKVSLQSAAGQIDMEKGEDLQLEEGRPYRKTVLVNIPATLQWALYYPVVIDPDDLALPSDEAQALSVVINAYQSGDLLGALSVWPATASLQSPGAGVLRAALDLAVGRVDSAEKLLASASRDYGPGLALREMLNTVKGSAIATDGEPATASQLLARTYSLQSKSDLAGALALARKAATLAPRFGAARARLAELEFSFGRHAAALNELDRALELSPRLAPAHALRGFVLLERGDTRAALAAFDRARELDAALGSAWVGRGLCLMRQREYGRARDSFQMAAALEPQRGLYRSYLGKANGQLGQPQAAQKELNLAKRMDPEDPTAWLYSALELWQDNRINEAIRDLERSEDLNDRRALFRSRLLLDEDRSIRSANLAALYDDAGLTEVSRHTALRSVNEDYANFSGHLFLANNYQQLEDANDFNLRLETARQSELLVANLLAPPGAGNLSQQLDQQRHLQYFDPRPIALSSLTEYTSRGDWLEAGTVFGSIDGFSYALDANYQSRNTMPGTNDLERTQYFVTLKQRISSNSEFYFQFGHLDAESGDLATYYDPKQAKAGFHITEGEDPTLYAGWHYQWSPGIHTLILGARLEDHLSYHDPDPNVLFLHYTNDVPAEIQMPPFFNAALSSQVTLYSGEVQQIFEAGNHSLVFGGRWQEGDVDTHAKLDRLLTGNVTDQDFHTALERGQLYGYYSWHVLEPWTLSAGMSYDHIRFPENTDFPPISSREISRDAFSPKVGTVIRPWERGLFRLAYTRSLGGLFFDNSVRLEPTQVGGFNQAFRSLIPESVAGQLPAAKFETAGIGFDQSFASGTWFGVEAEWLNSHGGRTIGMLTNGTFLPIPDSASGTLENLKFRERNLSAYAAQLLGKEFSVSASYRLSEATLAQSLPEIPDGTPNLAVLEQGDRSVLHRISLAGNFNHPSGFFAQWNSSWYHQSSSAFAGEDFWQHDIYVGYRFPRRYAELRCGLQNLFDTDYRLNPLNSLSELPRNRTFVASLRLNF